jgi:hypothetical protein
VEKMLEEGRRSAVSVIELQQHLDDSIFDTVLDPKRIASAGGPAIVR